MWTVRTDLDPTSGLGKITQECLGRLYTEYSYPSEEQAVYQGRHSFCLNGVLLVQVFDPEGNVAYSCSSSDGYWREHDAYTSRH